MRKIKCNLWVMILGIALQWVMAGCSSQLETTILSEEAPPEPEVTLAQEEPGATPQPVISETKVGEQDLGIPPARAGEAEQAIEPSQPTGPVIAGISPILLDPELPPEPTMRRGLSEEVAILEPEPIKIPEKEKVIPPAQVEPGLAPFMFDTESPPDPTLRGGPAAEIAKLEPEPIEESVKKEVMPPSQPEEIETPAEEKRIEVAKVQPGAPVIPIKTLADVYFDYDRYSLREDAQDKLNDNAQLLVDQLSGQKVVIEGHCDERGTQGYNMILGKRRAETVKKFLVDLGVPEENLEVITFGKERPFCTDHSMKCWQENRRGHFVVR